MRVKLLPLSLSLCVCVCVCACLSPGPRVEAIGREEGIDFPVREFLPHRGEARGLVAAVDNAVHAGTDAARACMCACVCVCVCVSERRRERVVSE